MFVAGAQVFNLIDEPLIRVVDLAGEARTVSLPGLYAALMLDRVADVPALQAHQRHALHAFLCQVGALACLRAGLASVPADEEDWTALLCALTPDHPDDAPWSLVTPPGKPAFLQAPAPEGVAALRREMPTPDSLDMLVTSKNHDVKAARLERAQPDDWIFALLSLQTMEGFLGAGNYGISRMNGGFSNRPAVGIAPVGGVGAHVRRDVERLIALRGRILADYPHYRDDGLALVWLRPWSGDDPLSPSELDPYYVEICRRVRLVHDGAIRAVGTGSKSARIASAKEEAGVTGDPWTPIGCGEGAAKALTVDARLFSYKRLADILDPSRFKPAPLQEIGANEAGDSFVLVCRALARGQGKTEGFEERRVPVPRAAVLMLRRGQAQELAQIAKERITDADRVRGALRLGLVKFIQNGAEAIDPGDPALQRRGDPHLRTFEQRVDASFFERLWQEVEARETGAHHAVRRAWLLDLLHLAQDVLLEAERGSPRSDTRAYRAAARARNALDTKFFRDFAGYFPKEHEHEAAA